MNTNEFLSLMKSHGATIFPPANTRDITLANNALQARRCAMFPPLLTDLYKYTSAVNLGNGYLFGPTDISRGTRFPIPSIVDINIELTNMSLRGKTIFGRNDLFFFAFDDKLVSGISPERGGTSEEEQHEGIYHPSLYPLGGHR